MSKRKTKEIITIFTDGACSNNGKRNPAGGIGIHFPDGELNDVSKVFRLTSCTNQRTELYAILYAVRYIKSSLDLSNIHLIIKTDSMYSINCVTKWVKKWKNNGWKTTDGQDVANKELIADINKYIERYQITFKHVDAHTGLDDSESLGNEEADRLAVNARDRAIEEMKNGTFKLEPGTTKSKSTNKSTTRNTSKISSSNILENRPLYNSLLRNKPNANSNNIIVELIKNK